MLQFEHILINITPANTAVDLYLHVVAKGKAHFLGLLGQLSCRGKNEYLRLPKLEIHALKSAYSENSSLTSATLTLDYDIATFSDGQDGSLLNG
jgi:hypothetical protein